MAMLGGASAMAKVSELRYESYAAVEPAPRTHTWMVYEPCSPAVGVHV